jgi:D-amino peptidase
MSLRVLISVDMEGIAGVVHEAQTDPCTPVHATEYRRACEWMTDEASAAVRGAFAAGAARVLVNDAHWDGRNLIADRLDPRAELLAGSPKPLSMMHDITDVDVACLVGYHGRAGTIDAVIDHTYNDTIAEVTLNGVAVGELGLNAALAGSHEVPIVLVTGDAATMTEGFRAWRAMMNLATVPG